MMHDDQMQYENSKDSLDGMCDNYEREKNLERKTVRSVHKKVRSKDNTEMDEHTKVDIFTNEFTKYMKVLINLKKKSWITVEKNNIKECPKYIVAWRNSSSWYRR